MKKPNFIKIGNRKIGPNFKPLVIFELGINHNGSLNLAKKIQYWVITLQFNNKLFVKVRYSKLVVLCQK